MRSSYCFRQKNQNNTVGRPLIPFGKVLDGILNLLKTGVDGRCCQKNMVLTLPAIGDGAKNTIGRIIPNIIMENQLEYDDKIIEKIIYFVTKASGNSNYEIHNIPADIDGSLPYF
ncbi:MAG: hypothetical protein WBL88_11350 [Nitrososphaeraceae archaeon]